VIRVLVAEDSHAVRLFLTSLLSADPEIEVVGEVSDGEAAVANARRLRPDVITMDIHMPVLDGLEATARIMHESPVPIVVVSTSVSSQDVASSMDALKAGALVALPKPPAGQDRASQVERESFVATVKAMARVKVVRRWSGSFRAVPAGAPPGSQSTATGGQPTHRSVSAAAISPLPGGERRRISLVAIAASTGGPTALQRVLSALPASFPVPILLVQHIARGFLPGFASWLDAECALDVRVARTNEMALAGVVYVAPDDTHLTIAANRCIKLVDSPPINGFKPSASVLFETAADAYGNGLAAVILTGMGSDGVSGLRRVKGRGGYVIAQDEESSLIYGMPGEATNAGVTDISLPLNLIANHLGKLTTPD
jgi:two-component system chemotaxis response regulator CheB